MDCLEQAEQPPANSEDDVVRSDIEYLIECLAELRNASFEIVDRPDIRERNLPQPDYLMRDKQTGDFIAIEHARFFESQEKRRNEATRVKQFGIYYGFINLPNAEELGKRLSKFFDDKIGKGQFTKFANCERILLARNRWSGIRLDGFLKAGYYFNPQRKQDCNHFYLIVERQLLEVF